MAGSLGRDKLVIIESLRDSSTLEMTGAEKTETESFRWKLLDWSRKGAEESKD